MRRILGSIVVLFSPLSINSLSRLLHVPREEVDQTLEDLHAILNVPDDQARPLRHHHPSFRDYLLNKDRCSDALFWVDENQAHRGLVDHCIKLMSTSLKRDICDLQAPGTLTAEIESSRVRQCLSSEVQYACIYWVQHIQRSGTQLYDDDQVHQFLQKYLLNWLEALGLMGKISEGILALTSLVSYIPVSHLI